MQTVRELIKKKLKSYTQKVHRGILISTENYCCNAFLLLLFENNVDFYIIGGDNNNNRVKIKPDQYRISECDKKCFKS